MTMSDAYLHAYVDNELTTEEFDRLATEILNSGERFAQAGDLLALKHLVRYAYATISLPDDV
jgi:hypothetical protein